VWLVRVLRAGRGGSTLAEQLIFSTTIAPPFLLDEPAKSMWLDANNHRVSTVNFDALRCDFSKFNHTLLLSWQHWRGEFTRQRKLLNYRSFQDMRKRCFTAGNGGHVRAVKTIRMQGELDLVGKACMRERTDGNYSCLLIQLVRHPLSTVRSERQSSRLPQARGVKHPGIVAPGGQQAWIDSRAGNLSGFCEPMLRDVQYAMALKRRKQRAMRNGKLEAASAIPDVVLLRYDELLRRPFDIVKEVHGLLKVYTSAPKLQAFVKSHLDPNYTVATALPAEVTTAPVVSMANISGGRVTVHKLRKRLKTEFGTVRPPRRCDTLQPMDDSPACAELLRLMHPLYLC
jgi:hypothetical protein